MNQDANHDFYLRLRSKITRWAKTPGGKRHHLLNTLLLAPDFFHLLCKLSVVPEVPLKHKAQVAAALTYFAAPIDLMPEALMGPAGYADDLALAAWCLNQLLNKVDASVVHKHWAGNGKLIDQIRRVIDTTDSKLGGGVATRAARWLERKTALTAK